MYIVVSQPSRYTLDQCMIYMHIYINKEIKKYMYILTYINFKESGIRKSQRVLELTPTPIEDWNLGQIHLIHRKSTPPMFNIPSLKLP